MREGGDASDLVQREIDGENTPEQSAELRRLMATDPGLAARHAELAALVRTLEAIGQEAPPAGLANDVMRAIRRGAGATSGPLGAWRSVLARRPVLGHAVSLAAGVAMGILSVGLVEPSRFYAREGAVSGTILPADRLASFGQLDRQGLSAEGVQGEAITRQGDGELLAELRVDSRAPLKLTLEFDPSILAPLAFERGEVGEGAVSLEPGRVRITHAGAGEYRFVMRRRRPAGTSLRLTVTGEGVALERSLAAGAGE